MNVDPISDGLNVNSESDGENFDPVSNSLPEPQRNVDLSKQDMLKFLEKAREDHNLEHDSDMSPRADGEVKQLLEAKSESSEKSEKSDFDMFDVVNMKNLDDISTNYSFHIENFFKGGQQKIFALKIFLSWSQNLT